MAVEAETGVMPECQGLQATTEERRESISPSNPPKGSNPGFQTSRESISVKSLSLWYLGIAVLKLGASKQFPAFLCPTNKPKKA